MNNKIKYFTSAMMVAAFGLAFTACDEWTEPEHVDINYDNIVDAENYPAYLENLRKYRDTEHTQVYAWVYLSEDGPKNQSERVTSLPDSIDVLVLSNPAKPHDVVLADLNKVRKEKGMKVSYQIDFDALKAEHALLCEELAKQRTDLELEYSLREDAEDPAVQEELAAKLKELESPALEDYILENLTASLNYVKEMKLDGVLFAFDGKASNHLTKEELIEYKAQQLVFLGAASDWHKRNPEMLYDFMGKPQNVSDPAILAEFNMILARQGLDATNADVYTYYLEQAKGQNIPSERLGMMATYISSNPDDITTGVFSNGTMALDGFAKWLTVNPVACIGIQNVQNDYFNPAFPYPHVRAAIQAANPIIK